MQTLSRNAIIMLIAAVAAVAVIAQAAFVLMHDRCDPTRTGDDHWSVEEGVLTITGNGRTADYGPENPAPWGTEITAVKVAEGVTGIGAYAFADCRYVTSFELPQTLQSIGSFAFAGCTGFSKITFPSSLVSVQQDAFQGVAVYNNLMKGITSLENIAGHEFILIDDQLCQMVEEGLIGNTEIRGYDCVAYVDDGYYGKSSTEFNWSLQDLCLELQEAARLDYRPPDHTDVSHADRELRSVYLRMGFENFATNPDFISVPTAESIGVAAASKKLADGSTLVFVTLRAGHYGAEWQGNFNIGTGQDSENMHRGFYIAGQKTVTYLKQYIGTFGIEGKIKVVITGYSRAGGASNAAGGLIDKALNNGENPFGKAVLAKNDLYVYTFEAPRTTPDADHADTAKYGNIFNVVYRADIVCLVPSQKWCFERFGTDMVFSVESEEEGDYLYAKMKAQGYDDDRYMADDDEAADYLSQAVEAIMDQIGSREVYDEQFYPAMRQILVALLYDKPGGQAMFDVAVGLIVKIPSLIFKDHEQRVEIVKGVAEEVFAEYDIDTAVAAPFSEMVVTFTEYILIDLDWSTIWYLALNLTYLISYHISPLVNIQTNWLDDLVPN